MYRNILVPMALDHGLSAETLKVAQTLLSPGGAITALHVYDQPHGTATAYLDHDAVKAARSAAQRRLEQKTAGLENVTPVMLNGHTARGIIDFAARHAVDCIVIGSHKPGFSDYFLGSTASRVVGHAPCAVHVLRSQG